MSKRLLMIVGLITLNGCADRTPLVFVSKTSVGVDVSAPGAGTGEFSASIGVNSLDAAYVPAVEITSTGETFNQVKSGESLSPQKRGVLAAKLADQIDSETRIMTRSQQELDNAGTDPAKAQALQRIEQSRQRIQALSEYLSNVLNRDDALSVFSAFDSNTILRADSAGQGFGKVFATGLAAQNVSLKFSQQAQALASCKAQVAPTAAKLAAETDQASKELALKLLDACK